MYIRERERGGGASLISIFLCIVTYRWYEVLCF